MPDINPGISVEAPHRNNKSMDPLTGAAIQTGGQIASGLAGLFTGNQQEIWNRKASDKAYERKLEFWNMQNEYNSPKEQMNRLREAGLNPHLMYGQGVQGATGQAKDVSAPQQSPSSLMHTNFNVDPLGSIGKYQEIQNMKAQERLTNAEAGRINELTGRDAQIKDNIIDKYGKTIGLIVEKTEREIDNVNAKTASEQARKLQIDKLIELNGKQILTEVAKEKNIESERLKNKMIMDGIRAIKAMIRTGLGWSEALNLWLDLTTGEDPIYKP